MADPDLAALAAVAEHLPALVKRLTEQLVLDVQTVAIAEAEGDLEGAWAIARPWISAIQTAQRDGLVVPVIAEPDEAHGYVFPADHKLIGGDDGGSLGEVCKP